MFYSKAFQVESFIISYKHLVYTQKGTKWVRSLQRFIQYNQLLRDKKQNKKQLNWRTKRQKLTPTIILIKALEHY